MNGVRSRISTTDDRIHHPVIVVGIPAYNEERHIAETIASLKGQSWGDFLAIVSDNASTDRTEEVCRQAIGGDPRFHFVRQPENRGAAFNFNYLLEASDSPYFMWLGAHDVIAPDFLEEHIDALEADPALSLSYSLTQWIDASGAPLEVVNSSRLDSIRGGAVGRYVKSIWRLGDCTAINNVVRRRLLGETRFGNIPGCDRIMLSELLANGPANLVAKPHYLRREVEHDRGDYMERITGVHEAALDMGSTARLYLASFDRLTRGRPSRWLLRPWLHFVLAWKIRRRFKPIGDLLRRWHLR